MKFIITILLITLSFNCYSQIDSIKSKFSLSTITNIFKKKKKNSLQNTLSDTSISTTSKKTFQDSGISDTLSLNKKVQTKKDTLLKTNNNQFIDSMIFQNELTKRIQSYTDSSSKAINIFIMNSNSIDVNVSSGGIVTVSKIPPGFNQQMFNNMISNNESKKKGFLADMDSSKLTSLITLILASIPLIISATK